MCESIRFIVLFIAIVIISAAGPHAWSSVNGIWFLENIRTPTNMVPSSKKDQIVIAVVDDGVRITHQDLRAFVWTNGGEVPNNNVDDDGNGYVDDVHGWDVSDHDNTVAPPQGRVEDFYHGTHLAGIVARIATSAYGDAAPAFVRIMPVKCLANRADKSYLKDGYKGIAYAIQAGADIILCAWNVGHISPDESRILQEARDKGILIAASAGNFPEQREQYPAAHESVLAVAALDQEDKKISRSNYGAFVDLSGPGVHVLSASAKSDTAYELREGTSQATAMVAVAAAMVKLEHPTFNIDEVKACLKGSAEVVDAVNAKEYSAKLGAGRLNIKAAMACEVLSEKTGAKNERHSPQGYLHYKHPGKRPATWLIKPHGTFKGLRFKPLSVQGKSGKSTLNFYANSLPGSKLLASYALDELPDSIYVPGTTAYVAFAPKRTNRKLDWLMEYRAEPIRFSRVYCRHTVYLDTEGSFEDGSGSDDYALNSDCKWLITAPEGKVIHFRFSEFDTEGRVDLVYFFNGEGTRQEEIMAIFSGPDIPPELTTWGNQVLVWFLTDGKNQAGGWKGEYRFRDP